MDERVKEYLVHCYLYYKLDSSIISDSEFDVLCKELLESGIEDPFISKEDLQAGTGYSITSYPEEVIDEAERRLKEHKPPSKPAEVPEEKPFELKITGHPMETWLLLGMYIDYGYARQRDVQAIIQEELARRWKVGMHLSEFNKYFKDHGVGPERFGLK